jgi:GNAT superfamily N-acetyltransferase
MQWTRGEYLLDDDATALDIQVIHGLLAGSYWAEDRPRATIERSIAHSLCFGLYARGAQVGFARFVTDRAVFSWLMDFIIAEDHRGKGIGKWMLQCMLEHPVVRDTAVGLSTRDAHGLYRRYGFEIKESMRRAQPPRREEANHSRPAE